eukprot:GILI01007176.1.p1 GENE.GILI01007176.1~~GILI01007176.1.p1  ORF type:complete len:360 (+),score=126.13 GILI01007176.1:65-1081(+)
MFARSLLRPVSRRISAFGCRDASTLVVAEHNNQALSSATLHAVAAASQLGGPVSVLVCGQGCDNVAKAAASIQGVSKVLLAQHPSLQHGLADAVAPTVAKVQRQLNATHIVAAATTFGKDLAPRVAVDLDVQPVADIISIKGEDTFQRPLYAGNALATVKSKDPVKVLTVRVTNFDKAPATGGSASVDAVEADVAPAAAQFQTQEVKQSDRPDLGSARVVVSGGRGLKDKANFAMLEKLADKLGGAVGASRAAVDAGYAANELQVGQTGKVVAPELYIAVGISGAIQHLAGMKDSKVIVAINKDAEAPIFQLADYGLVGDLFNVVPELTDKVDNFKSK